MVDALTPGEHVFLAGGTASVEVFSKRADVFLCARALNVVNDDSIANRVFINAMPNAAVEEEVAIFKRHGITLLCCKNSGGDASRAKLDAANILEIPVWMLARHKRKTGKRHQRTFDTLGALISAVRQMSVSKYGHSG